MTETMNQLQGSQNAIDYVNLQNQNAYVQNAQGGYAYSVYPYWQWPQWPPVQVVPVPAPVVIDLGHVADLEREVKRLRKCVERLTDHLDAQHKD